MSYNRRIEPSRSANSSHFYQRTIPEMLALRQENSEMLALRQENSAGGRHKKNLSFLEHSSELAMAPASPVVPHSNTPYFSSMRSIPYETQNTHQFSQYHHQGAQMYQEPPAAPQRHPSTASFYGQSVVTSQMPRFQPQTPAHQPYYGVPGFYTPSPNYASSYGESVPSMNDHHTGMCDDAYVPAETPVPRPQPSTTRSVLGARTATNNAQNIARRPLPSPSTPARKRTALNPVTSELTSNAMPVTPNKQTRFTMEINSEKESKPHVRSTQPTLHIFSGPVQRILKWEPTREQFPMLFEVVATLKSIRAMSTHQELLLRDETGPVLQVLFYEIDRPMPKLQPGQLVRVVGRMISRARLQAFSVRPASEVERCSMQRISFVCNRAATPLLAPATT